MEKKRNAFVKLCGYCASPQIQGDVYIDMDVVVGNQLFSFMIKDPNWVYSEGKLDYEQLEPKVKEIEKYKIRPTVFDLTTKTNAKMTDIEQEIALHYVFDNCRQEMTRIRQEQEEKMMLLFGLSDDGFLALSEEELESLGEIYEVEIN